MTVSPVLKSPAPENSVPTPAPTAPPSSAIQTLHPAYFALVMATGIVSLAANMRGMRPVALVLFWINVLCYAALWTLSLARLARFLGKFLADLADHGRSVGFFP